MKQLISKIHQELKANIDTEYKKGEIMFFKEKIKVYGVRTPVVRKIAGKYFLLIKNLDKKKTFTLAESLLESGYSEEATIAFDWVSRLEKQYQKSDFKIFESWLKKYISNWAECDDFCTHAFAEFILQFPEFLPKLNIWARSKNRWLKRASAVILIYPIKKGKQFLNKVFEICNILLEDKDDLVQKGYGWLLKEASNLYQERVFDYVMKNKSKMPRTALRYAIEKIPEEMRKKAKKRS